MGAKKIFAIGLITASILAVIFKQKISKASKQYNSLHIIPTGIQDLQLDFNDFKPIIKFNMKLQLYNPLNEAFEINGVVAKLERIIIYDKKGTVLGVSSPNIGKVNVPARGSLILPQVPFALDVQTLAVNLIDYKTINKNSFSFAGIVSVLGAEYQIQ
jgi:hypothetical protein